MHIITNYLNVITYFVSTCFSFLWFFSIPPTPHIFVIINLFDATMPLDATRKAHNFRYVHIIIVILCFWRK